jgi:hypothetical protein
MTSSTRTPPAAWALPLLALILLASPASADIQDDDLFVVTSAGLYRVVPSTTAVKLLDPSALGLSEFVQPSVTWIPRTGFLLLTLRGPSGGGQVLRLEMSGPTPVVEDITAIFGLPELDPVDADACLVTDRAFVLDNASGKILTINDPGQPWSLSATNVEEYAATSLVEPRSLAVDAAKPNYGVVALGRFEVHRYKPDGAMELLSDPTTGVFNQVTGNPITGEEYLMQEDDHVFGKLISGGIGAAVLNMNGSMQCFSPVKKPVDVVWSGRNRRIYALAGDGVDCLFGGIASGQPHHVVKFPLAIGPVEPKLVTAVPPGIEGENGDLAVVRWDEPRIALLGDAGMLSTGTKFTWDGAGYQGEANVGEGMFLQADGGPADGLVALVAGFALIDVPLPQGSVLMPDLASLAFLSLDGAGDVSIDVDVPNDPLLAGLVVWLQWWADDSAAAGGPNWVHTRAAGYAIGD